MEPTVGFMYGGPIRPQYFFWMLNLVPPPVTVTDSSARKFRYGATGLTQILNKTDGVAAFD